MKKEPAVLLVEDEPLLGELMTEALTDLDDDLLDFRLDLAQNLKREFPDHFKCDGSAHVNPIAFLAGLAVFPFSRVGVRLARSHIADIAEGSRSFFSELW